MQELYPTDETLQGADAVLITGSGTFTVRASSRPGINSGARARASSDRLEESTQLTTVDRAAASAYLDTPWIEKLVEYVGELPKKKEGIKVFGICFGEFICWNDSDQIAT